MEVSEHDELRSLFTAAESNFSAIDSAEIQHIPPIQEQIRENIGQFMRVGSLIREYSIFSPNETIEEIDTGDLRYLLAAAYLGDLVLRLTDKDNRLKHLQASEEYIAIFLQQCKRLGLLAKEVRAEPGLPDAHGVSDLVLGLFHTHVQDELVLGNQEPRDAVLRRELKIQRYKREKQAKERLRAAGEALRRAEARGAMPVEREHVLALLDCWVHRACDNLAFLRQETRLLADVEAAREANGGELPTPPRGLGKAPPLKPFVITREMVKVFGAGYPSLPTLTVEQAAAREHAMGLHNCCSDDAGAADAKAGLLDEDSAAGDVARDEQTLKDRRWDAFKDDNPYGAGNRYNKS